MQRPVVLAIAAHPDDIEFTMAGTLCRLHDAGYEAHYLTIANGSCGSTRLGPRAIARVRGREAKEAARILQARYHPSRVNDLEIIYSLPLLRWLTGIVRQVRPTIVLTHPAEDYMVDHTETCRLAVTAAFARGMPNFASVPRRAAYDAPVTVYHAMPHLLRDSLGRAVKPGAFVDIGAVLPRKTRALLAHASQGHWLRATQQLNGLEDEVTSSARTVGHWSGKFTFAEGWWRHAAAGFCEPTADPLREALGAHYHADPAP